MQNYKLTIAYDGTRYDGWQRQGNTENTVEGKLERVLGELTGRRAALCFRRRAHRRGRTRTRAGGERAARHRADAARDPGLL